MVRKVRFRARLRSICVELYEVIRANRCLYLLTNLHWQAGFWEAGVFHLFLSEYVNQSHKFQKIEFLWRHPSLLYCTFFKWHYVISRMVLLIGSSSAIFCQLSVKGSQISFMDIGKHLPNLWSTLTVELPEKVQANRKQRNITIQLTSKLSSKLNSHSLPIFTWPSDRFVEKRKQKGFYISFCKRNRN